MRFRLFYLLLLFAATEASSDLVVFTSGHFLHVERFEVVGNKARLVLKPEGILTVELSDIDRLLDDELVDREEVEKIEGAGTLVMELGYRASDPVPDTPYGQLIFKIAKRYKVSPRLVAAVVRAESGFDERAISNKGARGLLQLMPATARRFGVPQNKLFDPAFNLEAGVRYLQWLRGRFADDLPRVLAAYNAGEGSVDRYGGVPPFRETLDFIRRIYSFLGLKSDLKSAQ